jgi:RNA-directed DNA polymerase
MLKKMKKRYPLNQSPLYKLCCRRKLAALLGVTIQELNRMVAAPDAFYNRFTKTIEKDGKTKERYIEHPKPALRRIQRRLIHLLDRIQPPEYLHSGFRGRSYITNAMQHQCKSRLAKIDVKKFFPSAYAGRVYRCFEDIFKCSPDVAVFITKLTTVCGHLPTGGNSSTMISFFAFKPMFDEIHALAKNRGLTMSCCVDDMTFSGDAATRGFLNEVHLIVSRFGLKTHKRHWFEPCQNKIVTGVALTTQGIRLPNRRRKKLHEVFKAFEVENEPKKKAFLGAQMLGRVTEAAQIENRFNLLVPIAAKKLEAAKQLVKAIPGLAH